MAHPAFLATLMLFLVPTSPPPAEVEQPLTPDEAKELGCEELRATAAESALDETAARGARARRAWRWAMARQDTHFLTQVEQLGCTGTCLEQVRNEIEKKRAESEKDRALAMSDAIDIEEVGNRAAARRTKFDHALDKILGKKRVAQVDDAAAHFQTVLDLRYCREWLGEEL